MHWCLSSAHFRFDEHSNDLTTRAIGSTHQNGLIRMMNYVKIIIMRIKIRIMIKWIAELIVASLVSFEGTL
jgi:hypothetical protein